MNEPKRKSTRQVKLPPVAMTVEDLRQIVDRIEPMFNVPVTARIDVEVSGETLTFTDWSTLESHVDVPDVIARFEVTLRPVDHTVEQYVSFGVSRLAFSRVLRGSVSGNDATWCTGVAERLPGLFDKHRHLPRVFYSDGAVLLLFPFLFAGVVGMVVRWPAWGVPIAVAVVVSAFGFWRLTKGPWAPVRVYRTVRPRRSRLPILYLLISLASLAVGVTTCVRTE